VRKLVLIVIVAILAILFVQPIRAYRSAKTELDTARTELKQARADKVRAIAEREALGTRAVLVREARRRGYIFPGETPFSIANR
jgi:Tfp pilus assembly protein PilE